MQVKLSLLGAFYVTVDERPVTEFRSDKTRALLAYLVLEGETPLPRSHLSELLWSGYTKASARSSLRMALANLNQLFKGCKLFQATYHTVQFLGEPPTFWCDALELANLQARDRATLSHAEVTTLHDLMQGDFLVGLENIDSFPFVQWLQARRARYVGGFSRLVGSVPTRFHNLPAAINRLIGRATDVERITALLATPDVRLVTLVGPPGVGKSRLMLAVAAQIQERFVSGTVLVALAAEHDPDRVATVIVNTLGLQLTDTHSPVQQLTSYLRNLHLLLLLDNFEQIYLAGTLITTLLAAAPNLKVLVTSRVALHLTGEWEYVVQPLATTTAASTRDLDGSEQAPAVLLFVERAQAVRPGFQLTDANHAAVAVLCQQLDGLPLAIELAAARSRIFSPQVLLERVTQSAPASLQLLSYGARDLPERHRTLLNAVQWSYTQLSAAEQQLFVQLAVFAGGFTLEAASAVCDATPEMVETLLMHSLLQRNDRADDHSAFRMLETLRFFCLAQLAELPGSEAELRQKHACYFAGWAQALDRQLYGPRQLTVIEQFRGEQDNWRAALTWAQDHALTLALQLATALSRFWKLAGNPGEGYDWLLRLTEQSSRRAERYSPRYAHARLAYYELAQATGQPLPLYEEQTTLAAIFAESHDPLGSGRLDWLYGRNVLERSTLPVGVKPHERYRVVSAALENALTLLAKVSDPIHQAFVFFDLGFLQVPVGEIEASLAYYQRALHLCQSCGDRLFAARIALEIAVNGFVKGEYDAALVHCENSVAVFRQARSQSNLAYAYAVQALSLVEANHLARGQAMIDEGLALARALRVNNAEILLLYAAGLTAMRQGRFTDAARLLGQSFVWALETNGNLLSVPPFLAFCELLTLLHEDRAAAYGINMLRVWGATFQARFPPRWQATFERLIALLQARLGPERFAAQQPGMAETADAAVIAWVNQVVQRVVGE